MFHIRASYQLPSLSFHDNRASHSRDTIWPWKFKVKGQGQRYPSEHMVQLTHFLSVSHQGILSTLVHFVPWRSGLPLKIQGQRSRSKVKVKGTLVSVVSSWLISFLFHINWSNHSQDMANRMFDLGKTDLKFYEEICLKTVWDRTSPKFNQVESWTREIFLPGFVAIGWAVLTLLWGRAKLCPASVA